MHVTYCLTTKFLDNLLSASTLSSDILTVGRSTEVRGQSLPQTGVEDVPTLMLSGNNLVMFYLIEISSSRLTNNVCFNLLLVL